MALSTDELIRKYPLIRQLSTLQPTFWENPNFHKADLQTALTQADIFDAAARLHRFRPYIQNTFSETYHRQGQIESPLIPIKTTQQALQNYWQQPIEGQLFLKADNQLPIGGTIEDRSGAYAVLKLAEDIAMQYSNLAYEDDYGMLASSDFMQLFSHFEIITASNGNLGLSIGTVARKLGFKVTIYLANNTTPWKQQCLQDMGVQVHLQEADFNTTLTAAQAYANTQENTFFIDSLDDNDLLLGYSTAALHLQMQFKTHQIISDDGHPVFIYLPAGSGIAAAGLSFGLKTLFGENIYPVLVEPTHAPDTTLALVAEPNEHISVYDIGLDNQTIATDLAIPLASPQTTNLTKALAFATITATDEDLLKYVNLLAVNDNVLTEPAAAAGLAGLEQITSRYAQKFNFKNATHILWATGGRHVPKVEMAQYVEKGEKYLNPQLDDFIKF